MGGYPKSLAMTCYETRFCPPTQSSQLSLTLIWLMGGVRHPGWIVPEASFVPSPFSDYPLFPSIYSERFSARPPSQQNPNLAGVPLSSTQTVTCSVPPRVFNRSLSRETSSLGPVALGVQNQGRARKWGLSCRVFGFSPAGISTYFANCLF